MGKIEALIEQILSKSKFAPKPDEAGKIYRDEPILFTAKRLEGLTPPRYRQMRKIAAEFSAHRKPAAKIFYEQGKFMEDFEDDFEFQGKFARYFPTYQDMNTQELRGYFSWRTRLRRGRLERTQTSFAFVHIYELINQIGVKSTEAGFFALKDFWLRYRELDYQIDRYLETWLRDYVVYNNLDRRLVDEFSEANYDQTLLTLMDHRTRGAGEIFSALNSISSYNLENSKFFKQRTEEFKEVTADVFARFSDHYDKKNQHTLFEKFFGKLYAHSYAMFQSAVFHEERPRADFVYEINPICKYVCRRGSWSCERFFGFKAKNQEVGNLLKNIDFMMRRKYNFKSPLKAGRLTKILETIINRAIGDFQEKRKQAARAEVAIDVSKLQGIRAAAMSTQSKLIVEEPPEEAAPAIAEQTAPGDGVKLSEHEGEFLALLLSGRPCRDFLRERGLMLSIIIDSINDKLFDHFGDTVMVEAGGQAEVIEDYLDGLKELLP